MANETPQQSLPVTQLRPFHTRQYLEKSVEVSTLVSKLNGFDNEELLRWQSSQEPRPDEDTAVAAFVKLVSHIVVLDAGEAYCIQDSVRNRVLICRSGLTETQTTNGRKLNVVERATNENVPTDFSIGAGKVSAVQNTASSDKTVANDKKDIATSL